MRGLSKDYWAEMIKNKLKILGFEFKSIDSFLIVLYTLLIIGFPIILSFVGSSLNYQNIGVNSYYGALLIIVLLIILPIIVVYTTLLIRNFRYNEAIEKKSVLKSFVIANLVAFALLFLQTIIWEVIRCTNNGEVCGLGLLFTSMILMPFIFLVVLLLILIMAIPLIIEKLKRRKT